jgi:hypothetical protein
MEASISFEQSERRRRAAIALFIAATFGLTTVLSLPAARLIPFPFRLPSAEVLGPPEPAAPPVSEWATGFSPESVRLVGGNDATIASVRESPRAQGSSHRPGSSEDDGRSPVVPIEEAVPSSTLQKDKVPQPPASDEQMSKEKWDVVDDSAEQSEGGK